MVGDDSKSTLGAQARMSLAGSEVDGGSGIGKGTTALTNSRTAAQGIHPPSNFGTGVGSISGVTIEDEKNSQWKNSSVYLKNRNKS